MCGSSPKPDPAIGQAAVQNAQIAKDSFDLAKKQWEFEQKEWEKYSPLYEQMMKDSLTDATKNRERSDAAWASYNTTFKPIEERIAKDAMTFDSPEEIARREGLAAGTVQSQIDTQRADTTRELGRMGVSAARAGQALTSDSNMAALAKAGAINQERGNSKLTGMALRSDAANLGRGLPTMGLATGQAANSNMGMAQATIGGGQTFRGNSINMLHGANSMGLQANNSVMGALQGQHQAAVASHNANSQAAGSAVGAVAMAAALYF